MQGIDIGEHRFRPAKLPDGIFGDGKCIDLVQQVVDLEHVVIQQGFHRREDSLVIDGMERFSSLGPYRDGNIMILCTRDHIGDESLIEIGHISCKDKAPGCPGGTQCGVDPPQGATARSDVFDDGKSIEVFALMTDEYDLVKHRLDNLDNVLYEEFVSYGGYNLVIAESR